MIYTGNTKSKLYIGSTKIRRVYKGNEQLYSSGGIVTYMVDSGVSHQEEVESDASCLSPTTFTPTKEGYVFAGWREDNTASETVLESKIMDSDPITLYAVFTKEVTVTYYNKTSGTPDVETKNFVYNNSNITQPTFEFSELYIDNYTFRGWVTTRQANAPVVYEGGQSYQVSEDTIVYATWQYNIAVSYNGNNSTSGSTASQSGTVYVLYDGSTIGATFILQSNGFTRTNYKFSKWAIGSTSGKQYGAGEKLTLIGSTVFYAVWIINVANTTTTLGIGTYNTGYNGVCQYISDGNQIELNASSSSAYVNNTYMYCTPSINCSLYSGIQFTITNLSLTHHYDGGITHSYASIGDTDQLLATAYDDYSNASSAIKTWTINFTKTSGTTQLFIHNTVENKSTGNFYIALNRKVTLIGRKG